MLVKRVNSVFAMDYFSCGLIHIQGPSLISIYGSRTERFGLTQNKLRVQYTDGKNVCCHLCVLNSIWATLELYVT